MPVGRHVLALHGEGPETVAPSDALCAILQVLNHLQDMNKDLVQLDRCLPARGDAARRGVPAWRMCTAGRRRRACGRRRSPCWTGCATLDEGRRRAAAPRARSPVAAGDGGDPGVVAPSGAPAAPRRSAGRPRAAACGRCGPERGGRRALPAVSTPLGRTAPPTWPRWSGSCAPPARRSTAACASCRLTGARPCMPSTRSAAWWTTSPTSRHRSTRSGAVWTAGARALKPWTAARRSKGAGRPRAAAGASPVRVAAGGFPGRDRRHADGCGNGDHRTAAGGAGPVLRPRGFGRGPPVGARLRRCLAGGRRGGPSSRPRAADDQHPARPGRGMRRAGGCICRRNGWPWRACHWIPRTALGDPPPARRVRARRAPGARAFRRRLRGHGTLRQAGDEAGPG